MHEGVNKSHTDGTLLYCNYIYIYIYIGFFYQKCSGSVRGYLAEKMFQRGYITEKSLKTTGLGHGESHSHNQEIPV